MFTVSIFHMTAWFEPWVSNDLNLTRFVAFLDYMMTSCLPNLLQHFTHCRRERRSPRRRSRSPRKSRSPTRNRSPNRRSKSNRIVPRYMVQIPKISLDMWVFSGHVEVMHYAIPWGTKWYALFSQWNADSGTCCIGQLVLKLWPFKVLRGVFCWFLMPITLFWLINWWN